MSRVNLHIQFSIAVALMLTFSSSVSAAIPTQVTYQGFMKQGDQAYSGTAFMKFAIIDGTTTLWSNDGTLNGQIPNASVEVSVDFGVFTVQLGGGSMTPLTPGVFASATSAVLRVWVSTNGGGTFEALTPDQPISSVPFALQGTGGGGGWTENGGNLFRESGNVGVGTQAPSAKLEVVGGIRTNNTGDGAVLLDLASERPWQFRQLGISTSTALELASTGGGGNKDFIITTMGTVGIGTAATRLDPAPHLKLEVAGGIRAMNSGDGAILLDLVSDRGWQFRQRGVSTSTALELASVGGGGNKNFLITTTGNVGIGTATPAVKLDVAGTSRTQVLEITGGDVAEQFPLVPGADPGTVLAIDESHPGRLQICHEAASRLIAGVVSGAGDLHAGVVLSGGTDHGQGTAVALSGRVWVKADATRMPIAVGDLLVSSARPGYAEVAEAPEKSTGRILGKAMSSLEGGTGMVLVLVSLQ